MLEFDNSIFCIQCKNIDYIKIQNGDAEAFLQWLLPVALSTAYAR